MLTLQIKRFLSILLPALLLLAPIHGWTAETGKERAFRWIDDKDYYPFISENDQGEITGIYYDIMTEIFRRLEIPLKVDLYPWKRAQKLIADGKGDGLITAMTRKRSRLFLATDPIYTVSERAFARRDNPRIREILAARSIRDLKNFKIVETIGSGWSEEHFKGLDVIWAPTYSSAINMLANGRADVYVLGKYPAMADLQQRIKKGTLYSENLKKIIPGPHQLAEVNFSLLIRRNSPYADLIPRINRILAQMKREGLYQAILDRYFGDIDQRLRQMNEELSEGPSVSLPQKPDHE